ncbi:MAG: TraB/GumN family protein [Proteobacteria bacterium]|nr:TraB/GumN family protein [Pseudomonadota bacterium]MDA0994630.1 TraB/GumN family protein [Pseudomonadota bacterium]
MNNKYVILKALLVVLVLPGLSLAADDGHQLPMWQVEGVRNRIYLLGSIHLLREKDHPIPSGIYDAYNEAEKLIMELDMDDLDPIASQALATELGLIQGNQTLADLLGADLYREAEALALPAEIPLKLLSRAEPWYAAMNVEMMLLMRIGFNPALGIETHMMEMAKKDQKEILGFETMRQQLEFLDRLSPDAQREMFMQALSDGATMGELMDSMIDAWRIGDTQYLEDNMLADMQDYPELNQTIVVDRNISWASQIESLMDDEIDYLIIVGTLHLVGEEGVPGLLAGRGHTVTHMRQRSH